MHTAFGNQWDLMELRNYLPPRPGTARAVGGACREVKALSVRTDEGALLGGALVQIEEGRMTVTGLFGHPLRREVGERLLKALRAEAARRRATAVWLEVTIEPQAEEVLRDLGWSLRAFHLSDPDDPTSPRTTLWSPPPGPQATAA